MKILLGHKHYEELENSFETLQLTCPACHKHLVKIKTGAAVLAFPSRKVGEIFCAECTRYKGPRLQSIP